MDNPLIYRQIRVDQKLTDKRLRKYCDELLRRQRVSIASQRNVSIFRSRHFGGFTMHKQFGLGRLTLAICISFALPILILIPGTRLIAQTDTGRIQGSVTDQTGAVIPGASIILTNTETNATQTISSDGGGNFTLAALPRANYKAQLKAHCVASQPHSHTLSSYRASQQSTHTSTTASSPPPTTPPGL